MTSAAMVEERSLQKLVEKDSSSLVLAGVGGGSVEHQSSDPLPNFPLLDLLMDHLSLDGTSGAWLPVIIR